MRRTRSVVRRAVLAEHHVGTRTVPPTRDASTSSLLLARGFQNSTDLTRTDEMSDLGVIVNIGATASSASCGG